MHRQDGPQGGARAHALGDGHAGIERKVSRKQMSNPGNISADANPVWHCRGQVLRFDARPLIMGILNVTPDSFSDGGRLAALAWVIAAGTQVLRVHDVAAARDAVLVVQALRKERAAP